MVRRLGTGILVAVMALTVSLVAPRPASGAAAAATLFPTSYATLRGGDGGQHVSALALNDQSGTQNDWRRYVEFTTPGATYSGHRTFRLPAGVDPATMTRITLTVNYRGPLKAVQTWSWSLYNWQTASWVKLGDNVRAQNWRWTRLTFRAPGPPGPYVNAATRALRVRLRSSSAVDDAQMDYEALVVDTSIPSTIWRPAPLTTWQWQLSGPIDTTHDVAMYDVDLFDAPRSTIDALHAAGRVVICYFSAGSWENWRPDAGRFPAGVLGSTLSGWPDERWLDVRNVRALGPIMKARLDRAVAKGCDGVEPDNVDGYANDSGFPLTGQHQRAYNRWLAAEAHNRGLSIGLKNDLGQVVALVGDFDWALNEQCFQYDECDRLAPFVAAGKAVFVAEYALTATQFLTTVCPDAATRRISVLRKRLDLGTYRLACP
jgi:hypothetical protein